MIPESPYFRDFKIEVTICVASKLAKVCMKMLNLEDFEESACHIECGLDQPKVG